MWGIKMEEKEIIRKQLETLAEAAFLVDCMCHGLWDVACTRCKHTRHEEELAIPCMIEKSRKIALKELKEE